MSTVALIDDHESVRLGLEAACLRDGEQRVVFSGATVKEYLTWRATSSEPPVDVVVLDLTLGDGTTVTENVATLVADGRASSSTAWPIVRPRCVRRWSRARPAW